jgi:branched-chain amino acid transport system substrate-binding protein
MKHWSGLSALVLLAAVMAGPQADAQEFKIGVSEPLTGNIAQFGIDAKRGAELAVEEINAAGGVLGRKIVINVQDNRCNPAEAARSVTQMLSDKDYVAIVDGLCSSSVLAIMPIIERAEIPYVVANASATSIAERSGAGGNKWTFKTNPSDAGMAVALVNYLVKAGAANNIATLAEETDYGRSGTSGLAAALARHNFKLASSDFYQPGTADFSPVLAKLRARKPGQIAVYSLGADFKNLVRQFVGNDVGIPLTGRILPDDVPPELLASGKLDGMTAVHTYSVEIDTPANKAFVGKYRAKFNAAPTMVSFQTYEAIFVVADAIKRSGTGTPAAIREALTTTNMPSMVGGVIKFDANNLAHNKAVVLTIKGGKVIILDYTDT